MINWKKFETGNKILGLWHFLKSLVTQIGLFRKIVYKTQRMENDRKKRRLFFIFSKTFRSLSKSESKVKGFAFFEKIVYKTQRMENHRYFVLDSNFTFVSNEKYFEKWTFVRQKTWSQKWTFLMSQLNRSQKNDQIFLLLAIEILHAHVFLNVIFHAEHDAHS